MCCLLASLIHRTTLSQRFDCEMKNIFENNDNGDDDDDYLIAYTVLVNQLDSSLILKIKNCARLYWADKEYKQSIFYGYVDI